MTNTLKARMFRGATALALLTVGAAVAIGQDSGGATLSELAIQQAEAAVRVASLRRDLRRRERDAAVAELRVGTGSPMTASMAEVEVEMAERELAVAQLDLEEVRAAGRPVRRDITAPLVGGRDFVSERWQMELEWTEKAAQVTEERVRLEDLRVRAGIAVPSELARARLDRERLRVAADHRRELLSLRSRFLAGEIGPQEAELTQQVLVETERERLIRAELAVAGP